MDLPAAAPVRLNLGAGRRKLDGYLSVDLSSELGGEPDIKADVKALPFADGAVEEIIAIHLLEHLYRWEAPGALREWLRVLRPNGGLLILELPDVFKSCRNLIDGASPRYGMWGLYGDPQYCDPLMVHRWGWSQRELGKELDEAGFRKWRFCDPKFHKVQRDMRVEATK